MPVTVTCPQCQTSLSLDDGFRGGVARCGSCGNLVPIPRAADEGVARGSRPSGPPATPNGPRPANRSPTDVGGSSATLISPRPIPTKRTTPAQTPKPPTPPLSPSQKSVTPPLPPPISPLPPASNTHAIRWIVGGILTIAVLVLAYWALHR